MFYHIDFSKQICDGSTVTHIFTDEEAEAYELDQYHTSTKWKGQAGLTTLCLAGHNNLDWKKRKSNVWLVFSVQINYTLKEHPGKPPLETFQVYNENIKESMAFS